MTSVTVPSRIRILIWATLILQTNCQVEGKNVAHPASWLPQAKPNGISICETFNCRSITSISSGDNSSSTYQLPNLEQQSGHHCFYYFAVPKCSSQPVLKEESINMATITQILSSSPEFANWSAADCPSYEMAVDKNCLTFSTDDEQNHKVMESLQPNRRLENLLEAFKSEGRSQEKCPIKRDTIWIWRVAIVILSAALVASLLTNLYQLRKNRQLPKLSKEEIDLFLNGGNFSPSELGSEELIELHELSQDSFTVDESYILGVGSFGTVCMGTVIKDGYGEHVAVKVMRKPYDRRMLRRLHHEMESLSYLGSHPNILELKGTCTADINEGRIFVFVELCEFGSLLRILRELNEKADSSTVTNRSSLASQEELDGTLIRDMSRWSLEIARAMEFIASKNLVHRDIAARNVFLTGTKQAKLSGFGLSRRMHDDDVICAQNEGEPLPWRSTAPQSFRMGEYSEKSDVWAFGILLWEIYTLGEVPYPGLSWDMDFPDKLENGIRLSRPTYDINDIYGVMLRCWDPSPERRPNFSKLVKILNVSSPGEVGLADVSLHPAPLTVDGNEATTSV